MKEVIESSITFGDEGIRPETQTIFQSLKTSEKKEKFDLTRYSLQKRTIWFDYKDDSVVKSDRIQIVIPKTSEESIKKFIISEINKKIFGVAEI